MWENHEVPEGYRTEKDWYTNSQTLIKPTASSPRKCPQYTRIGPNTHHVKRLSRFAFDPLRSSFGKRWNWDDQI